MAEQLRILVLANISIKEIAARLQIDEHIIMIAEQLFFDVRWALHASGWVVCQVIIPEIQAGALDMAAKLRVAFFGGPVMARAILDARVRLPDNDADRLFDREVLLRDRQTHAVVDMLTELGSAFEEDLPIFNASVGDQLLLVPDNEQYEVLVVFSVEDLGVLRACGISATLATGLECLGPADVDRLCNTFGLARKKSLRIEESEYASDEQEEEELSEGFNPIRNRASFGVTGRDVDADRCRPNESTAEEGNGVVSKDAPKGKRMVLVAWSPAKLERKRPPGFDAVTNYFKELNQYVGVDICEVRAWLATPGDIERLGFGMRYRDAGFVHEVLLDSLFDHMHRLEHLGREQTKQRTVATDFPAAVLDLRDALFAEDWEMDSANRRREALRHAERLLHQQVVKPMMDEAIACSSVRERAVGLAAAQLVQRFVIQGVAINARMTKMISQKGMDGVDAVPLEEIKAFLSVGDRLTKLFREIDRCRESSVSVIQEMTVPEPKPLALPRFD